MLVTHNETATGVTSDVVGVRKILNELNNPALLFVDGVSSVASIDFRMDEWGVDVAVAGSQKGFMLPTGLAIVCVSQKALKAGEAAKLPQGDRSGAERRWAAIGEASACKRSLPRLGWTGGSSGGE